MSTGTKVATVLILVLGVAIVAAVVEKQNQNTGEQSDSQKLPNISEPKTAGSQSKHSKNSSSSNAGNKQIAKSEIGGMRNLDAESAQKKKSEKDFWDKEKEAKEQLRVWTEEENKAKDPIEDWEEKNALIESDTDSLDRGGIIPSDDSFDFNRNTGEQNTSNYEQYRDNPDNVLSPTAEEKALKEAADKRAADFAKRLIEQEAEKEKNRAAERKEENRIGGTFKKEEKADIKKTAYNLEDEKAKSRFPLVHTIKKGDSIWSLAVEYYSSGAYVKQILDANKEIGDGSSLKIGQKITVPYIPAKKDNQKAKLAKKETKKDSKKESTPSGYRSYRIVKGDTIYGIARRVLGSESKAKAILLANPGLDADNLKIGQNILLPLK